MDRECINCGYAMEGLPAGRCPECGYAMTEEELRLGERRKIFLELTAGRPWLGALLPLAITALAWVFFGRVQIGHYAILASAIATAWTFGVGRFATRRFPRGYRRLARRVWACAALWLLLPYIVEFAGVLYLLLAELQQLDVANPSVARENCVVALAVLVVTPLSLWRWGRVWASLGTASGLGSEWTGTTRLARGWKWAIWLPLTLFVLAPAGLLLVLLARDGISR